MRRIKTAADALTSINCRDIPSIQQSLLDWFDQHKRDLPWRKRRSPYWTWVSEIMLQQTQVAAVVPYFERWVRKYPNIAALAKAQESDVLKIWEGLGYYSRARNLLLGARQLVSTRAGRLPSSVSELRQVPGIGRYTAGAIASIAFNQPEPILDGNVTRVLCRLWDIKGDPRKSAQQRRLWAIARHLATHANAATVNESLMEFGALVCTVHNPRCGSCPLRRTCRAYTLGHVTQRPQMVRRTGSVAKRVHILIARRGRSEVLLHQRDRDTTPWATLWTFPYFESPSQAERLRQIRDWLREQLHCREAKLNLVAEGRYSVTRFRVSYAAVEVPMPASTHSSPLRDHKWVKASRLGELVMPAPHRRLATKLFHAMT
jgi:A/G-specific adenine glycosylase